MRKLILLLFISLSAFQGYSQVWENVSIDSGITVSIPKGYHRTDTLEDYSITARTSFGNILITKTSDVPLETPDIYKKRHLDNYYKNYVRNIAYSSKGTVSDEQDTLIGKLRVKDFTLHISASDGKKSRKFRLLHENSATYTFQFLYNDVTEEFARPEIDKFFNSINLVKDLDLKSQFTDAPEGGRKTLLSTTNIIIGLAALLILTVLISLRLRKKTN